jgi:hypothetical protein
MRIDKMLEYSDAQNVSAAAESTNIIDHKATALDLGAGNPMAIVVTVTTALVDGGSNSTLAVTLETETTAGGAFNTTGQTIGTLAAVAAAGTRLVAILAPGAIVEEFSRLYYTPANGDLTSSGIDAHLVLNYDSPTKAYPNNVTF